MEFSGWCHKSRVTSRWPQTRGWGCQVALWEVKTEIPVGTSLISGKNISILADWFKKSCYIDEFLLLIPFTQLTAIICYAQS